MGFFLRNMSWMELLYAIVVLVGVVGTGWCISDVLQDRRVAQIRYGTARDQNIYHYVIRSNLITESLRLYVQLFYLALAALALYLPVSPPRDPSRTLTEAQMFAAQFAVWIRWGFFSTVVALMVNSYITLRYRYKVRAALTERDEHTAHVIEVEQKLDALLKQYDAVSGQHQLIKEMKQSVDQTNKLVTRELTAQNSIDKTARDQIDTIQTTTNEIDKRLKDDDSHGTK
jgi:hypothetical protein